ncbi:TonB-dependent receptor [Fulvivirgaceae bacterium BMA10]|uniref:TonB-dependent receptor n=1 Tax=Splendidivirga corallicola TaxID=3051826 RepID=A0ABT8KQZ3_9BACT|nr:TonB-dependent receptor [Fulvivirgaceae bacterium BMA10]
MNKILLICLMLLFGFTAESIAQERTVSGQITDESGESIPGVNIVLKGTSVGVTSDIEGNWKLSVPSEGGILIFSYIGLTAQEVEIGNRSIINVTMRPDVQQLTEVVITGLGGAVDRSKLTTTVNTVNSDDLKYTPIVRIDQLLQSKLPNTQILQSSGAPGTTGVIRGRGINSALTGQQPVVYVDGVRVDNLNTQGGLNVATGGAQSSSLADIPVDQIDDITFLKGGAATTLYGSDAANGVLLITTKKGEAGRTRISYEAQLGAINGTGDYFVFDEVKELGFRTGFLNSQALNISGGNDAITYNFFAKYRDDNSFQFGQEERRYTIGGGYNATISKKLNYQGSFSYISNNYTRLPNANSSFDRTFGIDQGLPAGQLGLSTNKPSDWTAEDKDIVSKLIRDVASLSDITTQIRRFTNSHKFSYDVIEGLSINAIIGLDFRNSRAQEIQTNEYLVAQLSVAPGTTTEGSIERVDRSFLSTTGTISANWTAKVGDFTFNTVAGAQFFRNVDDQQEVITTNQAETSTTINISADQSVEDFQSSVVNYGYFVSENIGWKDKVFLDIGFRNDFNTAFGDDASSKFYPKAGISYNISEEDFLNSSNIISNLKVRGSFGRAGNFPPPYTRDAQLNANAFNGQLAFQPGQVGSSVLAPEELTTIEGGVDLGLLSDRINLEVTYYTSTTKNALFSAPFAPSFGSENQVRNLGEIENKGWEIYTRVNIIDNNDLKLSANLSWNKQENVVVSGGGAPEFSVGGFTFLGSFIKEGLPVGYFRGSQPTFAEDGSIASVEENAVLGKPTPDAFGSLGINASWRDLSLFVSGDYQYGAAAVNTDEVLRFFRGLQDDRIPEASNSPAAASFFDLAGVWVEDTDFLKVRNITLGYDLRSLVSNIGILRNASIAFTALNPINFHSSVFDPEITGSGSNNLLPGTNTRTQNAVTTGGFGFGTVSAPRMYIFTLRLGL